MLTLKSLLKDMANIGPWEHESELAAKAKPSTELAMLFKNLRACFPFKIGDTDRLMPYARAAYSWNEDCIFLRHRRAYRTTNELAHSFVHEAAHASGSERRLARMIFVSAKYIGWEEEDYILEEITAELTAVLLMRHCKAYHEERAGLAYVKQFLDKLPRHPTVVRRVTRAIKDAEKASKYLLAVAENNELPELHEAA